MDFIEKLQELAAKIPRLCPLLQTEEATKNALVMPFIAALGYDIFDPTEVVPEFNADFAAKKGEKVDYAILKNEKIIMLFECKHCGGELNVNHAAQLFRYFSVTEARIACLTNGIVYRFFTDLEAPNKMDDKPFLEVNMNELNEATVAELKKLTQSAFDIDALKTTAGELKYTREIKRQLAQEAETPSDDFVRLLASKLFDGPMTPARREYFGGIVKRAFHQFINERLNERLKNALGDGEVTAKVAQIPSEEAAADDGDGKDRVVTTEEEREGFYIVKAILRQHVAPERIVSRDTISYMGILLDDNNRKPLARLHFNRAQKYIGLFNENRSEERLPIDDLNDLYHHADKLRRVLAFYEQEKSEDTTSAAPTSETP